MIPIILNKRTIITQNAFCAEDMSLTNRMSKSAHTHAINTTMVSIKGKPTVYSKAILNSP